MRLLRALFGYSGFTRLISMPLVTPCARCTGVSACEAGVGSSTGALACCCDCPNPVPLPALNAASTTSTRDNLFAPVTPPAPSPAACSACSAGRQSESRSGTQDTSSSWDQEALLRDSSVPPARSPALLQKSKWLQQPAENSRGPLEILHKEKASRRS